MLRLAHRRCSRTSYVRGVIAEPTEDLDTVIVIEEAIADNDIDLRPVMGRGDLIEGTAQQFHLVALLAAQVFFCTSTPMIRLFLNDHDSHW
jgi:hypothetical protein